MLQIAQQQRCMLGGPPCVALQAPRRASRQGGLRVRAMQLSAEKAVPVEPQQPQQSGPRERVLFSLVAQLAESNAMVQKFEFLAGRGAMVGLIVATVFELLVPSGSLFGDWQATSKGEEAAWATAAALSASAALAAVSHRRWRSQRLLEPVIASLTSKQRSAGSLSKQNVDKAVDFVLDDVFSPEMLRRNFPLDDL